MKQLGPYTLNENETPATKKFAEQIVRSLHGNENVGDFSVVGGAHTSIRQKKGKAVFKLTDVKGELRVFMGLTEIYKGKDANKAAKAIAKELK